jgi:hypothetical protein
MKKQLIQPSLAAFSRPNKDITILRDPEGLQSPHKNITKIHKHLSCIANSNKSEIRRNCRVQCLDRWNVKTKCRKLHNEEIHSYEICTRFISFIKITRRDGRNTNYMRRRWEMGRALKMHPGNLTKWGHVWERRWFWSTSCPSHSSEAQLFAGSKGTDLFLSPSTGDFQWAKWHCSRSVFLWQLSIYQGSILSSITRTRYNGPNWGQSTRGLSSTPP